jgi:hypothetical protein
LNAILLVAHLAAGDVPLAKGRAADAQLISRTVSRRSGKKRDRYWLSHHVERLCAEAKVPVGCAQSLRGLHASVATEAGATPHAVASALGHRSPAVTHALHRRRHRPARTDAACGRQGGPGVRAAGGPGWTSHSDHRDRQGAAQARSRGSGMAAKPVRQVGAAPAPSTVSSPAEPASAGEIVGNGAMRYPKAGKAFAPSEVT